MFVEPYIHYKPYTFPGKKGHYVGCVGLWKLFKRQKTALKIKFERHFFTMSMESQPYTDNAICPHCNRTIRSVPWLRRHARTCAKRPKPAELAALYADLGSTERVGKALGVSGFTARRWLHEDGTMGDRRGTSSESKNGDGPPFPRHLMQHVWRRRFTPNPTNECENCPALAFCSAIVDEGLVACETPDDVQAWHLKRRGISLREVAKESGGLLG